jgi:hypothetical protein
MPGFDYEYTFLACEVPAAGETQPPPPFPSLGARLAAGEVQSLWSGIGPFSLRRLTLLLQFRRCRRDDEKVYGCG